MIDLFSLRTIIPCFFSDSSCLADGPEEVEFAVRSSCVNETVTQIFHGTRSYQRKFSIDVTTSGN